MEKRERVKRFGEVFTPAWVVNLMCDNLPEEAWEPGATFLEPTCGDGAFVCEILRRKFSRCKKRGDYTEALRSVYAMEIQAENVRACIANAEAVCREFFAPTKAELQILNDHIIQADALKIMRMIRDLNEREAGGGEPHADD